MRLLIVILLLFLNNAAFAFTFAPTTELKPSFLPVNEAFKLSMDAAPQDGKIQADWQISPGYYLYQNQLSLSGPQADKLHFATFPKGEQKTDKYFGEVTIYKHQLSVAMYYDISLPAGTQINATLHYQGCAEKGLCYAPQSVPVSFIVPEIQKLGQSSTPSDATSLATQAGIVPISEASSVKDTLLNGSPWAAMGALFGLGLLLAFTPCVLPMIPIVSAIVVGSRRSKFGAFYFSGIYVLAMAVTYGFIGAIAGTFGNQINLQAQLQSPIVLGVSALLFILLAMAMFGVYELKLPASWQNRLQQDTPSNTASKISSTVNIFIAGVLATLIVSPCVSAPVAGVLIYISTQNDIWYGALMLFVMGLGMGIPLLLVGLFGPKILPSSGPWLNDTKVMMGFGLLAVAIWLTTRWLPDYTHLMLWGALALGISGYFIDRAIRSHSHPVRWFFALFFGVIGAFEIYGGASGSTDALMPLAVKQDSREEARISPYTATISGLDGIPTLLASNDDRPIVLDLYADWCISCKDLEETVFKANDMQPFLQQVRLIKVDVTKNSPENQRFMKHFDLFGPPSILFLDKSGNELKSLTLIGEPSKEDILERVKYVTKRK